MILRQVERACRAEDGPPRLRAFCSAFLLERTKQIDVLEPEQIAAKLSDTCAPPVPEPLPDPCEVVAEACRRQLEMAEEKDEGQAPENPSGAAFLMDFRYGVRDAYLRRVTRKLARGLTDKHGGCLQAAAWLLRGSKGATPQQLEEVAKQIDAEEKLASLIENTLLGRTELVQFLRFSMPSCFQ